MEVASGAAAPPWNTRLPARQAPRSCLCPRRALVLYCQRPKCQLSLAQASVPISSVAGAPSVASTQRDAREMMGSNWGSNRLGPLGTAYNKQLSFPFNGERAGPCTHPPGLGWSPEAGHCTRFWHTLGAGGLWGRIKSQGKQCRWWPLIIG